VKTNRRSFLQTSLAVGALTVANHSALLRAMESPAVHPSILQAEGSEIVEGGRAVRLRGMNLGGWMLIEDYIIGLPWTEWKIRE
jgi:succinate dehydrogenase/fumarate reductase flavoprotein subunit